MEKIQFSELLLQNATFLKTQALKFTRNAQDADDLQQETLCKALEYRDNYKNGIDLRPWLYVIMRNIFINIYRRKKKSFQPLYTQIENLQLANRLDKSYYIDTYSGTISSQIDKLPDKFKTPFLLHMEGYKYAEIASLLDEPMGTIKSRIFFARQLLQSVLERS
ncbi:RNA polymerase sigma factor [Danxiaibacter flavus]|uniref:RNA polymerase sigma factor n=1 Tax=Danxiaibacter flavus TaxID=3049108 RepID=A0ABV3Z919_9BACT|nr:RNA polymerase sigma factor [Chitinophagaceae bacterium DXS]